MVYKHIHFSIYYIVEEDLHSSFDAYQGFSRHSTNPMGGAGGHNASGTLGSHLSPNGVGTANGRTFADMHEVHYASNNASYQANTNQTNPANYTHSSVASLQGDMVPNFNVNATVHNQQQSSNAGSMYDNGGYRPETRTPIGMTNMGTLTSHRESGLPGKVSIDFIYVVVPYSHHANIFTRQYKKMCLVFLILGYSSNQNVMHAGNDDSVLNLKREFRDQLTASNNNAVDAEEGSTPTATTGSTSEQVCITM